MTDEKRRAHLAMIQGIINRLSQNSFLLKGWSVLLISALLAFAARSDDKLIVIVAFLPAMAFWSLDGYFLRQERLFRALYNKARTAADADVDYDLNTRPFRPNTTWWKAFRSSTLITFHATLIVTIIAIIAISSVWR